MTESALYIKHPIQLGEISDSYQRLYFGEEFCERKVSANALADVLQQACDAGLAFTYVTPFISLGYMQRIIETVHMVMESDVIEPEVVINDWGVLCEVEKMRSPVRLALGRLLNKQKKGPEILNHIQTVNVNTLDHFRRSNTDSPYFVEFLQDAGFSRIEMDNLLCGIRRDNPIPASLHFPFAHVSTTRACKFAGLERHKSARPAIRPCRQECRRYDIELRHKAMPVKLFLNGNTHFYQYDNLPRNLDELNIDRLVYSPCV